MLDTEARYRKAEAKRLYYLSMEFLIGRSLDNNLANLGLFELCRQVLGDMGLELEDILGHEDDATLGPTFLGASRAWGAWRRAFSTLWRRLICRGMATGLITSTGCSSK